MKSFSRIAVAVVALSVLVITPAFAKKNDKELNLGLNLGTEPASGFGTGYGLNFGGGIEVEKDLQVRGDISYNSWSRSYYGFGDVKYTRIPVLGSVRKYFTLQNKQLKAYAQGGLEISFDTVEVVAGVPPFAVKGSASETHLGITGGGGIDYYVNPQVSIGGQALLHLITDSYLTIGVTAGYHF